MKKFLHAAAFAAVLCCVPGIVASCSDEVTPPPPPPEPVALAVPANIAATATPTSIDVAWDAVEHAASYLVRLRDAAGAVKEQPAAGVSARFEGLENEAEYEICVGAVSDDEAYLDSPFSAWIACRTGEGVVARAFAGGTGTADDPWQVATPGQLRLVAQCVNSTDEADAHYLRDAYRLVADIDLGGEAWTPIGAGAGNENLQAPEQNLFRGIFDGNGHTVSGLNAKVTADEGYALAGLFGILVAAQITDLTVRGDVTADCLSDAEAYAGGISAIASIDTQLKECRFEGGVTAGSSNGSKAQAVAGGISATVQSAALEGCAVVVPEGKEIAAIGLQAYAGGICGIGNAGKLIRTEAQIDGRVHAGSLEGIPEELLPQAAAGGVSGNNFGVVIDGAEVRIAGEVTADGCGGTAAVAGGLAGSNAADAVGGVQVDLTGSIVASDALNVCAAGAIANQQHAGYGVANIAVTAAEGSRIAGVESSSAAYVGGVQGRVSYQLGASTTACSADLAGRMEAQAVDFAVAGGVGGTTVGMIGCHARIRQSARIAVDSPNNALFGGVLGNASAGNVYACYAILDGQVEVGGEGVTAFAGGVSGVWQGNRMAKRYMNGCYALVRGGFTAVNGAAASNFGAVVGNKMNAYGYVNGSYWYSDSLTSLFGNIEDPTGRMEGITEADWQAAAEGMNAGIVDYGSYRYDAALGWLVFDRVTQE